MLSSVPLSRTTSNASSGYSSEHASILRPARPPAPRSQGRMSKAADAAAGRCVRQARGGRTVHAAVLVLLLHLLDAHLGNVNVLDVAVPVVVHLLAQACRGPWRVRAAAAAGRSNRPGGGPSHRWPALRAPRAPPPSPPRQTAGTGSSGDFSAPILPRRACGLTARRGPAFGWCGAGKRTRVARSEHQNALFLLDVLRNDVLDARVPLVPVERLRVPAHGAKKGRSSRPRRGQRHSARHAARVPTRGPPSETHFVYRSFQ